MNQLHSTKWEQFLLREVTAEHVLAHWLLCQSKPELTGLQGNVLILVLSPLKHVLQHKKEHLTKYVARLHCLDTALLIWSHIFSAMFLEESS